MLRKLTLDNYLTIRSMEHAFGVKYTEKEIEKLLKVLNNMSNNVDDGDTQTTRSKI